MKSNFNVGQVVKYSKPQPGEEGIRFFVNEIHESDGDTPEKLHVELICEDVIKPTFCLFATEFEPSWYLKEVEYMGRIVQGVCFGKIVNI